MANSPKWIRPGPVIVFRQAPVHVIRGGLEFLVGGLLLRYVLRARSTNTVVLVPVADLILLVATIVDLAGRATADWTHTLAASYLGFSVAFGHTLTTSMDRRFAYRFAGGPKPRKPPKYGAEKTRYEWELFGQAALAIGIALAFTIWAAFPISYTLWPAKPKEKKAEKRARSRRWELAPEGPRAFVSTVKLRQAGFTETIDTEDSFRHALRSLIDQKLLPPA